ncbi:MAG: zinc-binding alcohol dehydrogenase [Planctomycetes bacterium]|nr:zinc-binding alcohol dehydrogenase [Planctomycetota bacterium]
MSIVLNERKVIAYNGKGEIAILTEDIPELLPNTVLVEVKASLISPGTELMGNVCEKRRSPNSDLGWQRFGYGNSGIVLAVGEGVAEINVGDRIACMGGQANHATHCVVPQNLTCKIPEELSFEEAAFAHLAATGLHAVRRSEVEFGQTYGVMGLGLVGNLAAQFAKLSGAHVLGMDGVEKRLQIAADCGIDRVVNPFSDDPAKAVELLSRGYGLDIGLVAFGGEATRAIEQLASLMKKSPDTHAYGNLVIVGGVTFSANFPTIFGNMDVRASSRPGPGYHDHDWEQGRDYPRVFVQWTTKRNLEECLRSAAEGKLQLQKLITHRIPFEDGPNGCEKLISSPNEALGVILEP